MQKLAGRELLAAFASGNVLFAALTVFPASAGDLSEENMMLKERLRLLEAKVDALLGAQSLFGNSRVSIATDENAAHGDVDHGG